MEKGRLWSWLRRRWRGGARGGGGEVRVEAEKVAAVKAAVWVACRPSTRESRSHLDSRRAGGRRVTSLPVLRAGRSRLPRNSAIYSSLECNLASHGAAAQARPQQAPGTATPSRPRAGRSLKRTRGPAGGPAGPRSPHDTAGGRGVPELLGSLERPFILANHRD